MMKKQTKYYKKLKIAHIKVAVYVIFAGILLFPSYQRLESSGDNIFTVYLNGTQVGTVESAERAENCLIAARRRLAGTSDELVLTDSDLSYEGREVLWGAVDDDGAITEGMTSVLRNSVKETLNRSYTVKINEYTGDHGHFQGGVPLCARRVRHGRGRDRKRARRERGGSAGAAAGVHQ